MATESRTRPSTAADQEKIRAIRTELPATQERAYLNTGTNGPLSRRAVAALVEQANTELNDGRIGMANYQRMGEVRDRVRARVATIFGCSPDEVALTHNTTEGMNIAIMGVDWQPGDEVITATTEHPGGLYPTYLLKQRHGVRIRMTEIGLKDLDPVEELRKALTPRTKAVVLSHVSWSTGMVLPLRELADLAHSVGALLICDAAQSAGMVPLNLPESGVDAYACAGQKWLCGPDGTGALYVRKDRLPDIQLSAMYHGAVQMGMSNHEGYFVPPASARRYEGPTMHPASVKALGVTLDWLVDEIGLDWIYARIADLGAYAHDAISTIPGVTMHTPRDRMAGLVHFSLEGVKPADLTARLVEENILIRHTPYPQANRVATGFFNTEEEIDRLVAAVEAIGQGI